MAASADAGAALALEASSAQCRAPLGVCNGDLDPDHDVRRRNREGTRSLNVAPANLPGQRSCQALRLRLGCA